MGKRLPPFSRAYEGRIRSRTESSVPDLGTELTEDIMNALDAHNEMSTRALNSEKIRQGLKDILLNHTNLYEKLRKRSTSA
ncbi:hypothetical protein [Gimesia sp.]|uniref:hypothetical protein n=1 Tax=Gimesia sp. TaxID=2024833 RepID=UPI003A959BC4